MDLSVVYGNRFCKNEWEKRAKMWQILCAGFFDRLFYPGDTVLDLAAGYCEFINHVCRNKPQISLERVAVDMNPDIEKHADDDVKTIITEAKNLSIIKDRTVDVIFVSNFFEHVKDKEDIIIILRECHRILKPYGRIMILQPNINYLMGAYWDFFDHYTPLNEKSLCEALNISGCWRVTRLIKKFLPYSTKSRIPQATWMIWLYIRMPIAWRVIGKQTFLMAEKMGD